MVTLMKNLNSKPKKSVQFNQKKIIFETNIVNDWKLNKETTLGIKLTPICHCNYEFEIKQTKNILGSVIANHIEGTVTKNIFS